MQNDFLRSFPEKRESVTWALTVESDFVIRNPSYSKVSWFSDPGFRKTAARVVRLASILVASVFVLPFAAVQLTTAATAE